MLKDVALCLYRVAQESLRNLAKHAAVGEASMDLIGVGSNLVLRVSDQGVGFDTESPHAASGLGRASVAERVNLVHGKLTIDSVPRCGTTIEVHVPLERAVT